MKIGQPFGVQIFIDTTSGTRAREIGITGLKEIIKVVIDKFSGLEERDIYLLEVGDGRKNALSRASNLEMLQL